MFCVILVFLVCCIPLKEIIADLHVGLEPSPRCGSWDQSQMILMFFLLHRHYCKRFVNALHTHSQYGGTRLIKTFFQFFIKQLMLPLGFLKQIIQIFFFLFHFISFFGIFMLNRFGLGLIRTNKNGFTNFFVFAKIFDCKVRKIRLHAVLVHFFLFLPI